MKGIILAGGSGSRLHPLTLAISKQLLPIYNKPMIYYPLSVLMQASIRDILVISTPADIPLFQRLLKDGSQFGIKISYETQEKPNGIAEAFIIGKHFIGKESVCLILGDNIFYGHDLKTILQKARKRQKGATLFGYEVKDANRYGVMEIDKNNTLISIEEKPKNPKSHYAVTGLYFYDNDVIAIASQLKPSTRGELEITDVNCEYIRRNKAFVEIMGRGLTWLDAGTYQSLLQANQLIQAIEERQGQCIAAPEEIAYRQGFISKEQLLLHSKKLGNSSYGQYLKEIANASL